MGSLSSSRGSSQLRDQTQFSCIAGGFLPTEPQGKLKNTGVDSYPFSSGSADPGNELGSLAFEVDSLPTELSWNIVYSTIKKNEVIPFVAT